MQTSNVRLVLALAVLTAALPGFATTAYADTTVADPWEVGITGTGGFGWTEASGDYSLQRISRADHPEQVRHGDYSLRVEVRSGDDPISSSGERAEVSHLRSTGSRTEVFETRASGTKFYAFSVRLDTSWQPPDGTNDWGILFQLHSPWDTSPSFAFNAEEAFRITGQVGNVAGSRGTDWDYVSYELDAAERGLALGHWIDWVIEIRWAFDTTGAITVYRRDEGETDFTVAVRLTGIRTLQHQDGADANHYWKHGFYRSASDHTNILWLDGFTRADTFDEAVLGAFGTTGPIDPGPGPGPEPEPGSMSIANMTNLIDGSDDLVAAHEMENLFDGCLTDADGCTAGTDGSESLWAEFDLGRPFALSSARLFGDANGVWVSRAWTLETRLDASAPWEAAFTDVDARTNDWSARTLSDRAARYLRVTVHGDAGSSAVQARELEVLGEPLASVPDAGVATTDAGTTEPAPDAATPEGDAGASVASDGGFVADAGPALASDGGVGGDAGHSRRPVMSSGCSVSHGAATSARLTIALLVCAMLVMRRRRAR